MSKRSATMSMKPLSSPATRSPAWEAKTTATPVGSIVGVTRSSRGSVDCPPVGVTFTREPSQEPWGGWIATIRDPDGNVVQLLQPS